MSILDKSFTYNGINYDNYNLKFMLMETSEDNNVGGNLEYKTSDYASKITGRKSISKTKYSEVLNIPVEFFSESIIGRETFYEIEKNLFNQAKFAKLCFINDLDYEGLHYNCYFTNVSKFESYSSQGFGVYGFKANMVCDSEFIWEENKTFTYTNFTSNITLNNKTSKRGYTYPKLKITMGLVGGNVQIQCITDNNRLISFTGLANEVITLSYIPLTISSSLNADKFTTFNKHWLQLVQGNNVFHVNGNVAKLEIIYDNAKVVY